ncbi:uncharacterized protein LOC129795399 [Lutzomyia longipalpis]|uniref:uncharacterized protein LOC129795399 n=1 Tax=Lutzomyia longipalpis TaxID=7200 RepID=UPI0024841251|nr:uncharacterized protein LOC129795399 [Lutzomyia longipalpis]
MMMKCLVVVMALQLGALMGGSWADEYIDMCPCLPVNMCRGVFRASPEDEMYFSRVLQCPDEMNVRCCNFSVTIATEASPKSSSSSPQDVTTEMDTISTGDFTTELLTTEDVRFDREEEEDQTTTETSTIENRANANGVLVIYPTEMTGNATKQDFLRSFDGDSPENELILVFPQESPRETRATAADEVDPNTTPQVPKQVKKYRYSNSTRKRFMPLLKINETQSETAAHTDGKPIFKVTNSDNRRFLEELYRNRTRFGVPASQITTSATPIEVHDVTQEVQRKTTQHPTAPPRRNLFYDPTKRKNFLRKNTKEAADGSAINLVQNSSNKQAVDINHREMIQEVLSELKKESSQLAVSKDIVMDPKMAAKIGKIQKRLIERIVDTISTKMEGRDDFEEITATTKREQSRPFRGSLRYVDTLKNGRVAAPRENLPAEGRRRPQKQTKGVKGGNEVLKKEFIGETSLPIGFRPSPLWTLQRSEDPFPVPLVSSTPAVPRRESRDIVTPTETWSYRGHGFVPIPQIPRTEPIQIIGPIPKGFTHVRTTTEAPSELPVEGVPPNFRRFTGKVFSRK